jgi:hypothetical protein
MSKSSNGRLKKAAIFSLERSLEGSQESRLVRSFKPSAINAAVACH